MIVSWLLRLVAGLVIGKVWRHVSGRSARPAPARIPIRPDREITERGRRRARPSVHDDGAPSDDMDRR